MLKDNDNSDKRPAVATAKKGGPQPTMRTSNTSEHNMFRWQCNTSTVSSMACKKMLFPTLSYEAPAVKPLPPGIADNSDISDSNSVCRPLTSANDLQELNKRQCSICLVPMVSPDTIPISLRKCGHNFHLRCIQETMKHQILHKCPECGVALFEDEERLAFLRGNMPSGTMDCDHVPLPLLPYARCGIIMIKYNIPSSCQQRYHPIPSKRHNSSQRVAYLPDTQEGLELLFRLQAAFLCGLTFTIGTSLTVNGEYAITWGGIRHETTIPEGGYYLSNCSKELDEAGLPSNEVCSAYVRERWGPMLEINLRERRGKQQQQKQSVARGGPTHIILAKPTEKKYDGGFPKQSLESVFSTTEVNDPLGVSSIMKQIDSIEFHQFLESSNINCIQLEKNTCLAGSTMLREFVKEGRKCLAEGNCCDVRIVFHGTPEANITSILRSGLDPTLRKRQKFGQGEYFASNPAMPLSYCKGGSKLLVFAVIITTSDIVHNYGIIVVNKRNRQLPIGTISFSSYASAAIITANSFQANVTRLLEEAEKKEKLLKDAQSKENIIMHILKTEYLSASEIYIKACNDNDGLPPVSWAEEVALYIRDHIRDNEMVEYYFPNLPQRPLKSEDVPMIDLTKCEADAKEARRKLHEAITN